ncbi:MAG: hypothetical protein ACRD3G_08080 [Vicinamibacterales bacterium]
MGRFVVAFAVFIGGNAFAVWLGMKRVPESVLVVAFVTAFAAAALIQWWPRWKAAWYAFTRTTPMAKAEGLSRLRVLERHYLSLALLKEDGERLKRLERAGGSDSGSAFVTMGIALDQMRSELINLAPQLFTTSDALDIREKEPPTPPGVLVSEEPDLADDRVPREIDHLMKTVLRLWRRYGEVAGVTPLRFKEKPIVKMNDVRVKP